ncbi:hypothetical protein SDJN03_20947, partial [Cucurbita argyrosperma subsp. sororia]
MMEPVAVRRRRWWDWEDGWGNSGLGLVYFGIRLGLGPAYPRAIFGDMGYGAVAIDISLVMLCCSLLVQLAKTWLLDLDRSFEYLRVIC